MNAYVWSFSSASVLAICKRCLGSILVANWDRILPLIQACIVFPWQSLELDIGSWFIGPKAMSQCIFSGVLFWAEFRRWVESRLTIWFVILWFQVVWNQMFSYYECASGFLSQIDSYHVSKAYAMLERWAFDWFCWGSVHAFGAYFSF